MSNILRRNVRLSAIPQVVSDIVVVDERYVFGPPGDPPTGVAANRYIIMDGLAHERPRAQFIFRVGDEGEHTSFTATCEGSDDGVGWFSLIAGSSYRFLGGSVDENGIVASAAIAQAGVAIEIPGPWPYYRLGLGGDNEAADGDAIVGIRLIREM